MFHVPLCTSLTCLPAQKFWDMLMIYHNRPHLVNRKLTAISQVLFCDVRCNSKNVSHVSELFTRPAILYEIRKLKSISKEEFKVDFIMNFLEVYDKNAEVIPTSLEQFKDAYNGVFVSVRIFLPRSRNCAKCVEVVVLDKNKNKAIFLGVSEQDRLLLSPPFPYEIELTTTGNLRINLNTFEDADTAHAEWLGDKLFTKLLKWTENEVEDKNTIPSLSLVPVDEYCITYNILKEKYGGKLVKDWPKKSGTDPQKYVFEDIAIASYLICFWQKIKEENVKFVDCGCGNGLLVYLLNCEGYAGYGIDVRKRPIWDIYPKETKLEVGTVTPTSVFPDCTWIIGNHSDELTPWIPVIALKSSFKTNFFVLPCCPFDFSGQKFIRTNTSISAYSDFLRYIHEVCNKCGFKTEIDKLRIPSTKRTCLVGLRKDMTENKFREVYNNITKFIDSRSCKSDFTPRSDIEKVRNCTQIDKEIISKLVNTCIQILLSQENFILKANGEKWNKGKTIPLSDLVKKLGKEDLKVLKKECGGLQTLLRNHRYLFEIKNGEVNLRQPIKLEESSKYKSKPCWFFINHPDGCLYETECGYNHS